MEYFRAFLCFCIICSQSLSNVSGRAIQTKKVIRSLQDQSCGILNIARKGETKSEKVELKDLLGEKITDFYTKHDGGIIAKLSIEDGFQFRLCNQANCSIFYKTVEQIPDSLRIVNDNLITARCRTVVDRSNEIKTCSEASKRLEENECARYYRSSNCDDSFEFESSKKNETITFHNEVFESMAIREKCQVGVKFSDGLVPPTDFIIDHNKEEIKNDLLSNSVFTTQLKAYPKQMQLSCFC